MGYFMNICISVMRVICMKASSTFSYNLLVYDISQDMGIYTMVFYRFYIYRMSDVDGQLLYCYILHNRDV